MASPGVSLTEAQNDNVALFKNKQFFKNSNSLILTASKASGLNWRRKLNLSFIFINISREISPAVLEQNYEYIMND